MAAMKEDPECFNLALKQGVLLVCPSTLLATLRLVESVWRYETQNRNRQEIARVAGQLYDKFVGFVTDMQEVGRRLAAATSVHERACSKLSTGRGNLVRTAEKVRALGVRPGKALPAPLVELACDADPESVAELDDNTVEPITMQGLPAAAAN